MNEKEKKESEKKKAPGRKSFQNQFFGCLRVNRNNVPTEVRLLNMSLAKKPKERVTKYMI